jgi:hypothetical protein
MGDIKSKRIIVVKGLLFVAIVIGAGVGIICYCPRVEVVGLLLILIWSSARSYYFVFYVLEKYVDPKLKYAGIIDLVRNIRK